MSGKNSLDRRYSEVLRKTKKAEVDYAVAEKQLKAIHKELKEEWGIKDTDVKVVIKKLKKKEKKLKRQLEKKLTELEDAVKDIDNQGDGRRY
jgi:hypothetical protein